MTSTTTSIIFASELNLVAPQRTADAPGSPRSIESRLRRLREIEGSDLLLVTGAPPVVRVSGRLVPTSELVLGADDIKAAVIPLMPARLQEAYRSGTAVDLAFTNSWPGPVQDERPSGARTSRRGDPRVALADPQDRAISISHTTSASSPRFNAGSC